MPINYDVARAMSAVEYLVGASYFPHRIRGLHAAVEKPRALPYKGEAEVLNELLVIGRQKLQAMENLIAIAEFKRKDDVNEYQREFMAQLRRRFKLACEIEERRTDKKLGIDGRSEFSKKVQQVWMKQRDAYIAQRVDQIRTQFGTDATSSDRSNIIATFWSNKLKELEAMRAETPRRDHNLLGVVETQPNTAIGYALRKAVDRKK